MYLHENFTLLEEEKVFKLAFMISNKVKCTMVIGVAEFFHEVENLSNREEIMSKILNNK